MSQQRDTAFAASLVVASLALAVLLARRRRRLPARFDLQRLVRPCVLRLAPYTFPPRFGLAEAPVLLDANENPHGSTVEALDAALHRYPDPRQARLKAAIAGLRGCAPSQVVVGCGSDEIIDLLIRVTCEPGRDSILVCSPTYAMYQIFASVNDVSTVDVPLSADDYQLRVGAILQSLTPRVKLVFLCSPGNPTGRLLRRADIEAIAAAATGSLRCRQPLLPPPSATASSSLRRRALSIAAVPEPALLPPRRQGRSSSSTRPTSTLRPSTTKRPPRRASRSSAARRTSSSRKPSPRRGGWRARGWASPLRPSRSSPPSTASRRLRSSPITHVT